MISLAPRKHLFATNLVVFFIIYIMRKCLQVFCIIENKTCRDANCEPHRCCKQPHCNVTPTTTTTVITTTTSPPPQAKRGLKIISAAMRRNMQSFGYGEGHFWLFVEKKERNPYQRRQ